MMERGEGAPRPRSGTGVAPSPRLSRRKAPPAPTAALELHGVARMLRRILPPLPVAPKLLLAIGGVSVYGLIVSFFFRRLHFPLSDFGEGITVLNGIVLGVLLV